MSAGVHVRMALRGGWEEMGDPSTSPAPAIRRRYRRDGRVLAALSLEVLDPEGATPAEFAAAASTPPAEARPWRRSVVVEADADPVRVVVHDLDGVRTGPDAPPALRRTATLTWFLSPDVCLQLSLVADDLLVIGDLGEAVRELADAVDWEVLA